MLNDSKEVSLILYLTGLVLAAVITITFVFGSYLNIYSGTYAVGICATSTVILCVVFISKVEDWYQVFTGITAFKMCRLLLYTKTRTEKTSISSLS